MGRIWIWILLAAALGCWVPRASAELRTALVIGNGSYLESPLNNPVNDARDMASVLKDCGFEVILRTNDNKAEMETAVRSFGQRLKRGGVALFFYAGHGIQVRGVNYMIPVGAEVKGIEDIDARCVKIPQVLSAMEDAGNELNIVILDACRNNPFQTVPGVSRGLALMNAPQNSYIAFSTRPGALSGDGPSRNGLYTAKLLKHIRTPGLSLVDLFMRVRNDVMTASNETQEPWDNHALRRHFYFVPETAGDNLPYESGVVASTGEEREETGSGGYEDRPDDTIVQGLEDEEIYSYQGEEEPDAPPGYRKEVVVEIHDGEPVEVVYFRPVAPPESGPWEDTEAPPEQPAVYYPTEHAPPSETEYRRRPPAPQARKPKPKRYRPRPKPPVNLIFLHQRPGRDRVAFRPPRPRIR